MEISVIFPFDKDAPDVRDSKSIHPFSTYNSATERPREVYAIVAAGRGGEIGFRGDMPWHLPEDLRHFKALTTGHPVIMGRLTWESLPKRPLPGRRNIVISHRAGFAAEGAETASSVSEALSLCPPPETPFIIGGGSVYAAALPFCSKVFLTRIDADFPDADTFFPALDPDDWKLTASEGPFESKTGVKYTFETYSRR